MTFLKIGVHVIKEMEALKKGYKYHNRYHDTAESSNYWLRSTVDSTQYCWVGSGLVSAQEQAMLRALQVWKRL